MLRSPNGSILPHRFQIFHLTHWVRISKSKKYISGSLNQIPITPRIVSTHCISTLCYGYEQHGVILDHNMGNSLHHVGPGISALKKLVKPTNIISRGLGVMASRSFGLCIAGINGFEDTNWVHLYAFARPLTTWSCLPDVAGSLILWHFQGVRWQSWIYYCMTQCQTSRILWT